MGNILITGASGDIGLATANKFASKGHNLALFGYNNYQRLEEYAAQLSIRYKVSITCHKCDVSDGGEISKEVSKVLAEHKFIDLLINNAGISVTCLDQDLSEEQWLRICNVNLSSAMYFCRALTPSMISEKNGKIINISSMWGTYGASCEAAYSATKGGLNAYTKALAKELAPSNISVNALALGAIDTKMNSHLSSDEKKMLAEEIPFGRMATTEETADMIYCLYIAPSYLTGQIIGFDGGY